MQKAYYSVLVRIREGASLAAHLVQQSLDKKAATLRAFNGISKCNGFGAAAPQCNVNFCKHRSFTSDLARRSSRGLDRTGSRSPGARLLTAECQRGAAAALQTAPAVVNHQQHNSRDNKFGDRIKQAVVAGLAAAGMAGLLTGSSLFSPVHAKSVDTSEDVAEDTTLQSSEATLKFVKKQSQEAKSQLMEYLELQTANLVTRWFSASAWVKILALVVGAVPLAAMFGLVYSRAVKVSVLDGLVKAYQVLFRVPGAVVTGESSNVGGAILHSVFLVGLFVFAVVLGIAADEVRANLSAFRSGNYKVVTSGHLLVLNWNQNLLPLLYQILAARQQNITSDLYQRQIVVLSSMEKTEMDSILQKELGEDVLELITTRQGSPYSLAALDKVSAANAATVVVLIPEGFSAQTAIDQEMATVLSLQTARSVRTDTVRRQLQKVVVQTPAGSLEATEEVAALQLIRDGGSKQNMQVVQFGGTSNIARIMAQASVQPGVSDVYCHIAEPSEDSVLFQVGRFPEMDGKPFGDVRRYFHEAIVLGLMGDRTFVLNPPDDVMVTPQHRLIGLARVGKFVPAEVPYIAYAPADWRSILDRQIAAVKKAKATGKRIIVLGWDAAEDMGHLVGALAEFAPPDSQVIFVTPSRPAGLPKCAGNCSFRHVVGDLNDTKAYEAAGVAAADAVIIGGFSDVHGKMADARVLSALMMVQNFIVRRRGVDGVAPKTHVVSMLTSADVAQTAHYIASSLGKGCISLEVLYPTELVGGLLSQVAAEPELAAPMKELIENAEGMEIYIRTPDRYNITDTEPVPFGLIAESARYKNEIAIGMINNKGEVVVVPNVKDFATYNRGSRIITIAEELD